jgi:small subunit ribosomal protein S1
MASGRVDDATTVMKEGQEIEAMIVNVDKKTRSIQLSIKARDNADTAGTLQRMSEAGASSGTTNLGALLKAKLDQAKDDE